MLERERRILLWMCVLIAVNQLGFGSVIPILPLYAQSFDVSQSAIGLTVAVYGLALGSVLGLLVTYPGGVLVDRYGRKIVIVPATIVSGLSMALFCLAPSYAWFLVACAAWGIASAVGGAAPAAYAADSAPPGMNAIAMSTFRMLGDVGYVVGPIVLGLVADFLGAATALAAAAFFLVVIGLLFARLAPETYRVA